MAIETAPTLADIEAARVRLRGIARETPVYGSETFSKLTGRDVVLKAENLQRTGAFKIRGAVNKLASLSEQERAGGVVAASAGNHGQAVAWAARELGTQATIFMPVDAPMAKVEATRAYGAEARLAGESFDDALDEALAHAGTCGATFVHAFEDRDVIAGQGTIGLELVEQVPEAQTFVVPIVLTEAVREEGVDTLWAKIAEHRAHLEGAGELEERRRRNLAGEVFAVASNRAKSHLERAVRDDPELRRLLGAVQDRSLDPLTAVREIMEKVFKIGDRDSSHAR